MASLVARALAAGLLAAPLLVHGQPQISEATAEEPVLSGFEFPVELTLAWPLDSTPSDGEETMFCRATSGGEVISPVTELEVIDEETEGLATMVTCDGVEVPSNGMATVTIELSYDRNFGSGSDTTGEVRVRAIPGGVVVLPPIVAVILAIVTRNVLVALFCGIWVAAFFIHSYDPFRGFLRTIDTYIVGAFNDEGHIKIILFSWFLSGITGLVQRSGGAQGLANSILKRAKTRRSVMICAFCVGCAIFFDDYANTLIVGNTFRPIMDSLLISREKLAFIADATSAPIASISPISSWIGFELSLIDESYQSINDGLRGTSLEELGYETSPFLVFVRTIPGRFYPIAMLFLQFLLILFQRDLGPMFHAERRSHRTGKVYADDADPEQVKTNAELENKDDAPGRWWNAVIPIGLVIILVFLALILTGIDAVQADDETEMSIENVFGNGDSYNALLWSTFFVSLITWALYRIQYYDGPKLMSIFRKTKAAKPLLHFKQSEDCWIEGIKQLVATTLVLVLAWAIGDAMTTVGTDTFIAAGVSDAIDSRGLSTIVFILAAVISLATGTSWGTMSILFPVATQAAFQSDRGNEDLMLSVIASILAGSVFGDHMTPISDTTILSSLAARCDLMHHVKTQAPYAILVGLLALFFGDLLSGYLYPMYVGLILTIVATCILGYLLSAKPDSENDKVDLVNKAFGALCCCGKNRKGGSGDGEGGKYARNSGSGAETDDSDSVARAKRSNLAHGSKPADTQDSSARGDGARSVAAGDANTRDAPADTQDSLARRSGGSAADSAADGTAHSEQQLADSEVTPAPVEREGTIDGGRKPRVDDSGAPPRGEGRFFRLTGLSGLSGLGGT